MNKVRVFVTFVVLAMLLNAAIGGPAEVYSDDGAGSEPEWLWSPKAFVGDYSDCEVAVIQLSDATAYDYDGDPLIYSWSVNTDLCTFDDPTLLHPTLTCLDDGEFIATLTVDDGDHPPVSAHGTVTVCNVAPTCGPVTADPTRAPVNTPITFGSDFTDPGVLDTHTAAWKWGDGTSSPGTVTQGAGSGSVKDQHSYNTPGVYTVTLVVTDNYPADSDECTTTVEICDGDDCNPPPIVDPGAYDGCEGSVLSRTKDSTAFDPNGDPLTLNWSLGPDAIAAGCTLDDPSLLNPGITCLDDGTFTATLTVDDGHNPPVSADAPVTVCNLAPACGPISAVPRVTSVNTPIDFSAPLADPGVLDTHIAGWEWGDGTSSAGTVTQGAGFGSVKDQHSYSTPGVYTVTLVVTDNYPADSDECTVTVAVDEPFVDPGAYDGCEGLDPLERTKDSTAFFPGDPPLTYSWSLGPDAVEAGCSFDDPSLLNPDITCLDDGEFTATLTVDDGQHPPLSADAPVTVCNLPPTCQRTSPPLTGGEVDELIPFSAFFTDPGVLDTHTADWDWGDETSSEGTLTQGEGFGSVSDPHSYSALGAYTVTLTITDNGGGHDTCRYTAILPHPPIRYFPIVFKGLPRICGELAHISGPWAKDVPEGKDGNVYQDEEVDVPPRDQLPEGGLFYLSSQPCVVEPIKVDDEITIRVGDKEVLAHDFKNPVPGQRPFVLPASVKITRETMEEMAGQTVTVRFGDLYGNVYGVTTEVYLIWVPDESP